ncbi:hypothetical protein ACVWZX_003354 [Deinococcus sp. UYEF24]
MRGSTLWTVIGAAVAITGPFVLGEFKQKPRV